MQILLVPSVGEFKPSSEERVYSKIGICQWKKRSLNAVFISRESTTNIHRYVLCADTNRGVKELVPALRELTII